MSDETAQYVDPMENPAAAAAANAAAAAIMADEPGEKPVIPLPRDGFVRLPGGLKLDSGAIVHDVEVRELTGAHEERLAKAKESGDMSRYMQTFLECGVAKVGDQDASPALLRQLLLGDRDYLLLQIRVATYGDEIEYGEWVCPHCKEQSELTLEVADIPIGKMTEEDRQFDVLLRKGGHATVRLPNGDDEAEILADPALTNSERNSILLSRCVLALQNKDGERVVVSAFPSLVRDGLGIVDRNRILDEIAKRQPGPRYDKVEYVHTCGNIVHVPMGLMLLFPGL
jgi:hypothetical protein